MILQFWINKRTGCRHYEDVYVRMGGRDGFLVGCCGIRLMDAVLRSCAMFSSSYVVGE